MQSEKPTGEGAIPKAEQPWNKERVMDLPGLIHDKAVVHMQKLYELGPDRIPFFFHTYHDPQDGADGHVASVVKLGKLYQAAVARDLAQKGKSEIDLPSSDCDPLHLYEKANKYFDGFGSIVPDGKGHSRKIEKPSPERRKLLIDLSFQTAASLHDLANVVAGVDWQRIRKGEPPESSVSFREAMCSDITVEGQAARMYEDFIGVFREELGLSSDEARHVASLGSEYVQDTSLSRLALKLSPHSLVELAFFDQIAAVFSPNSLTEVFGLINEMGADIRRKYPDNWQSRSSAAAIWEAAASNTRDVFFRDFVLNQLEKYKINYQIDPSQLFATLDGYKEANPAGFARIMGIGVENVGRIGKLEDFVRSRLDLRLAAGSIVWLENGLITPRFPLDRGLPMFDLICRACDLFNDRFYDPTLKAGDFQELPGRMLKMQKIKELMQEIRTPITDIYGFAQLMEEPGSLEKYAFSGALLRLSEGLVAVSRGRDLASGAGGNLILDDLARSEDPSGRKKVIDFLLGVRRTTLGEETWDEAKIEEERALLEAGLDEAGGDLFRLTLSEMLNYARRITALIPRSDAFSAGRDSGLSLPVIIRNTGKLIRTLQESDDTVRDGTYQPDWKIPG